MKFVGEVLGGIEGIQNFYITGLLIFITLFIIMIYKTIKIPKKDLIGYKTSIFDKDDSEPTDNNLIQK